MPTTPKTTTVKDMFFQPLAGLTAASPHARLCPDSGDDDFVHLGVQRVLETSVSGRAFLQEHGLRFEATPGHSNYLAALHSVRRCQVVAKSVQPKPGVRQIFILDNASWHKAARLRWHHFQPLFLPSYSPDFNPIERLWLRLKADWFWDFIARTLQQLTDRLCQALKSFIDQPSKTASICSIRK